MDRGVGITEWLRSILPEWTIPGFELFSLPGDLPVIVTAVVLLYVIDVGGTIRTVMNAGPVPHGQSSPITTLCSDRTAFMIAVIFGGLALIVFLESLFAFPRPPTSWHAVSPSEHGFPSGHTMAATITWGAIAIWSAVGSRNSRLGIAAAIVATVAFARLALGVHYLIDVLASILFGSLYLFIVAQILEDRPFHMFGVAIAIAIAAVIVTGGTTRALLALGGTTGAGVGWWFFERPAVRQFVLERADRWRS